MGRFHWAGWKGLLGRLGFVDFGVVKFCLLWMWRCGEWFGVVLLFAAIGERPSVAVVVGTICRGGFKPTILATKIEKKIKS